MSKAFIFTKYEIRNIYFYSATIMTSIFCCALHRSKTPRQTKRKDDKHKYVRNKNLFEKN